MSFFWGRGALARSKLKQAQAWPALASQFGGELFRAWALALRECRKFWKAVLADTFEPRCKKGFGFMVITFRRGFLRASFQNRVLRVRGVVGALFVYGYP